TIFRCLSVLDSLLALLSVCERLITSASVIFSFCLNLVERDLRSLPPRRSSDLRPARVVLSSWRLPPAVRVRPPVPGVQTRTAGRSEEHTSELQSRENLVCRLLLEKKNIPTIALRFVTVYLTSLGTITSTIITML